MSGPTWAPGPWSLDNGGVVAPECGDDGNVVCLEPEHMMKASQEKWPANARLIAAAPDLYREIEALIAIADEPADMPTGRVNAGDLARAGAQRFGIALLERLPSMRAAITLARGEHSSDQ